MIASSVRRISRSFYSASNENLSTSHHRTGSFAEISGVTRQSVVARKIAQQRFAANHSQSQSDSDIPDLKKESKAESPSLQPCQTSNLTTSQESTGTPVGRKLSKINLRKLKIW